MLVEEELTQSSPNRDTLLTIGVFDGVHLGHQYLLSQLTKQAREQNLLSGVVTFRQHPEEALRSQTSLPFLTGLTQRLELLQKEGIELIAVLSFTPELARLSARQFVTLLKRHLRMKGLVIGHDFALGQNRKGDAATLRALGQELDFTVTEVDAKLTNGEVVSSTVVRQALAEGDMPRVRNLLGRYFSLQGRVVPGQHLGARLGFPTANLGIDPGQALPADGVYATRVYIAERVYESMTNIGTRPTFGRQDRTIEVYVLDYQGNLYGREIRIALVDRLRDERRFETAQELREQIAQDIKRGRAILSRQDRG